MATTHIRVDTKIKKFLWDHKGTDSVADFVRKALIDAERYRMGHSTGRHRAEATERLDKLLGV